MDQAQNILSQEQPPVVVQQPIPQPVKKKWTKEIVLGVLVLLLLPGIMFGAMYFGKKKNDSSFPVTLPPAPTLKPTQMPVDETANWKTYVNQEYGYAVKYPSLWERKIADKAFFTQLGYDGLLDSLMLEMKQDDFPVQFAIRVWTNYDVKIENKDTFNQWCNIRLSKNRKTDRDCDKAVLFEESFINNLKIYQRSKDIAGLYYNVIFVPYKNHVVNIDFITGQLIESKVISYPITSKIFATFKFLDYNGASIMPSQSVENQPQVVLLAKEDLARAINVQSAQITVAQLIEKQWSDASLGCPQPDMMYAQVITPGYQAVFQYNGQKYRYNTDKARNFVRCDR